jgi:hypothetical protein
MLNTNNLDEVLNKNVHLLSNQLTDQIKPKQAQVLPTPLVPILEGLLQINRGTNEAKRVKILLDSGASATIMSHSLTRRLKTKKETTTKWTTASGSFDTSTTCKIYLELPELSHSMSVQWKAYVTKDMKTYDIIIGRDLLAELEILLDFKNQTIKKDHIEIPMRPPTTVTKDMNFIQEPKSLQDATERMTSILEAKYKRVSPLEIAESCEHLSTSERKKLVHLLEKHPDLFDGSLGKWNGIEYDIELKPDAKPSHARAYPVPRIHEATLKVEVARLCKIGVLRKINRSEWAAPSFLIPKKDDTVRFISDFRNLNKFIKRKPYPLPKIQDLLLKLEGFNYGTSLDLNMGYYHIALSPASRKLCTIVFPFGKYEYQRLPMGLANSPDIFQEEMSNLMGDLEYVRAYIDDLAILTKGSWEDHLEKLDEVLDRINKAGLKVNAAKSFFGRDSLEYLGYQITRSGIKPQEKKVQAILNIKAPTTKKQLRSFIGIVNYYRDMWIRRSEILAPLSALCSKTAKFKWTEIEKKPSTT